MLLYPFSTDFVESGVVVLVGGKVDFYYDGVVRGGILEDDVVFIVGDKDRGYKNVEAKGGYRVEFYRDGSLSVLWGSSFVFGVSYDFVEFSDSGVVKGGILSEVESFSYGGIDIEVKGAVSFNESGEVVSGTFGVDQTLDYKGFLFDVVEGEVFNFGEDGVLDFRFKSMRLDIDPAV